MVETKSEKKAKKANQKNLSFIKDLFMGEGGLNAYGDQMYGNALGEISKVGNASRMAIQGQERQQMGGMQQNLASSGLWGSTVQNAMSRGIHSDAMRNQSLLEEDLAKMRAGLLTGQAGFRQGNMQSLASILGGVQYNPGTTMGDALKSGFGFASLFGGGAKK